MISSTLWRTRSTRVEKNLATKDDLLALEARLKADAAEREARMMQSISVFVGVTLTAIALATGVIIAVVTLT